MCSLVSKCRENLFKKYIFKNLKSLFKKEGDHDDAWKSPPGTGCAKCVYMDLANLAKNRWKNM